VPGLAHFSGGVEALLGLAPQGFGEESRQGLANLRVEEIGGDGDLIFNEVRRALAIAPAESVPAAIS
jgi:hypothetical protein